MRRERAWDHRLEEQLLAGASGMDEAQAAGRRTAAAEPAALSAARPVAVVCESTACLPPELAARYQIGVVPIPFVFGNETYLDGVDITPAEVYARLVATRMPPKTSPPPPGAYLEAWKQAVARMGARAVVLVTVSSRISTLQRSARLAQELAAEALAGTPVAVVDSGSAGMAQGFVALAAARAAAAGASLEEVVAQAEAVSRRVTLLVTLDTLEYLARASHLPQVVAFLGGLLAIKPIVQVSGDIKLVARVRTRRRALEELFERMRRMVPAGARLHAAVQHACAAEEARQLEARIKEAFDCAELLTSEFTPVMGSYCGPGLVGVAFYTE